MRTLTALVFLALVTLPACGDDDDKKECSECEEPRDFPRPGTGGSAGKGGSAGAPTCASTGDECTSNASCCPGYWCAPRMNGASECEMMPSQD